MNVLSVVILICFLSISIEEIRKRELTYWEIVDKIAKYPSPKLEGEEFSDSFKDFIAQCLEKSMDKRCTSDKLLVMYK